MNKIDIARSLLLRIEMVLGFMSLFTLCAAGYSEFIGYAHWFQDLRGAGCGLALAFVVVYLIASYSVMGDAKVKNAPPKYD